MSASIILRRTALVLTSLFGVGGIFFALGNAFDDPGGWKAVLITVGVVVPLAALVVLALGRPEVATTVLTGAVVLYALWAVATVVFDPVDAPTMPIIALILAVPIAVMGQRHPWHAGALLAATAAMPLLVVLVRYFTEARSGDGPGLGALFGASTGVVVLPIAVFAILFLTAGSSHLPLRGREQPPTRPLPPAAMSR